MYHEKGHWPSGPRLNRKMFLEGLFRSDKWLVSTREMEMSRNILVHREVKVRI